MYFAVKNVAGSGIRTRDHPTNFYSNGFWSPASIPRACTSWKSSFVSGAALLWSFRSSCLRQCSSVRLLLESVCRSFWSKMVSKSYLSFFFFMDLRRLTGRLGLALCQFLQRSASFQITLFKLLQKKIAVSGLLGPINSREVGNACDSQPPFYKFSNSFLQLCHAF